MAAVLGRQHTCRMGTGGLPPPRRQPRGVGGRGPEQEAAGWHMAWQGGPIRHGAGVNGAVPPSRGEQAVCNVLRWGNGNVRVQWCNGEGGRYRCGRTGGRYRRQYPKWQAPAGGGSNVRYVVSNGIVPGGTGHPGGKRHPKGSTCNG